ncbi:hypothetical protein HYS94_04060 [Candidatus Daviesbacteria bacterium]|nr:hypothetical protein [Candidatus Daviesbacteria bacterium]
MSEKDLASPINNTVTTAPKKTVSILGEGFKIQVFSDADLKQYEDTIAAYDRTNDPDMTLDHIGHAAELRNELVERVELDAPVQEVWPDSRVRVQEYGDRKVFLKSGGRLELVKQLPHPATGTFASPVPTNSLVSPEESQIETRGVIHGLDVSQSKPQQLPDQPENSLDQQRANSIYFQAPAKVVNEEDLP